MPSFGAIRASLLLVILVLCLAPRISGLETLADGSSTTSEPVPVSLVLLWQHQAQFAGYYMALEQGFYKEGGLNVTIRRGGPDIKTCEELVSGRADFCVTMLTTAAQLRANGTPLVLLSQVVNRSNFALVAWKWPAGMSGAMITRPADLNGRRMSVWEADLRLPYKAFLETQAIKAELFPQYYTLSLFLQHGVDACAVMRYNEFHRLMQNGVRPEEIIVFILWEHGVMLPEDGLYVLEQFWRNKPEECRNFVKASLEGWRFARDNPEKTLDVVMRYVQADNLPTNRAHMRWMLREILRSIFPEEGDPWEFGRLSPSAYDQTIRLLQRGGPLSTVPIFDDLVIPDARHVAP